MEITELRIGNIVHWGDHDTKIDINMLWSFDKYKSGGLCGEPLTPEWLVKLGFVEVANGFNIHAYNDDVEIGISITDVREYFTNKHLFYRHSHSIAKIEYVHQIQNLYFELTRQELAIHE